MSTLQVAAIAAVLIVIGLVLIAFGTRPSLFSGSRVSRRRSPHVLERSPGPSAAEPDELGYGEENVAADDVAEPAPALLVISTRPFSPLVPADHESTGPERRSCREQIGSELDADLSEMIRLLERRPAELRGVLMTASTAEVAQELATLRAYLRGALTRLDDRLRNGPTRDQDRDLVACLVSGLRRLPTHHGAVYHRAHRGQLSLDGYFPGSLLVEPTITRTDRTAFPAGGFGTGGKIDYVIWSENGRRAPLLIGHGETVLFAPATRFRVLEVDEIGDEVTVFLAEEVARPVGHGRRRDQILEHLRSQAAGVGPGPIDGPAPAPDFHPGLDETGRPYAVATLATPDGAAI